MKILNVTPYCISNYGAMLQAWALRSVLEQMGHEVVYLKYPRVWPGKFGLKGIMRSKSLASIHSKLLINRQMESVRREVGGWCETRPYYSFQDLQANPPQADCYTMDGDLWNKFFAAGMRMVHLPHYCWGFRMHAASKTSHSLTGNRSTEFLREDDILFARRHYTKFQLWLSSRCLGLWKLVNGSMLQSYYDTIRMKGKDVRDVDFR